MQYLKEDIKEKIISSAITEFKTKGYMNASMREIAKNAGVATGNIYRYFKNKEELFNGIIAPVYNLLMNYAFQIKDYEGEETSAMYEICKIKDKIIDVFKDHSTEMLILIDKSEGSKYANIKEEWILLIDTILNSKLIPDINRSGVAIKDEYIIHVLSSTLIEGIYVILRNQEDGERIKFLVDQLLDIFFLDIKNRLK